MITKTRYMTGRYNGVRVFRCHDCPYDVLENESTIIDHCENTGHGKFHYADDPVSLPLTVNITVGYLCWNTREASVEGAVELLRERARLRNVGINMSVCILDNGSVDGTYNAIMGATRKDPPDVSAHLPENCGSSISRNHFIDFARHEGSKYLALIDGDIEVVPLSLYEMVRYMEAEPSAGCIGAYSSSQTAIRAHADTIAPVISNSRVRSNIQCAWTQYGVFRTDMFNHGVRFETGGPFGVPGWGLEDDDLYFQMERAGWDCRYFTGMTYLHRALHSSWASIADPRATFESRKDYFLTKWHRLGMDPAILNLERGQQFPVSL